MNKSLLLSALILFSLVLRVNAQMIQIPDSVFRQKLTSLGYGTCIVADSIDTTCPTLFIALTLDVSGYAIHDLQGIQAFTGLKKLNCSHTLITSIPALPSTLDTLVSGSDSLTSLPTLPATLVYLDVDTNQITALPSLPANLNYLDFSYNKVNLLSSLPATVQTLKCYSNLMTSLPTLPALVYLDCHHNSILYLPALPSGLQYLDCYDNVLTNLPALPSAMTYLNCTANNITSLPTLPTLLVSLYCELNNLSSLPYLPSNLQILSCNGNILDSLPPLPASLTNLRAGTNNLTWVPSPLPSSLFTLDVTYNHLTSIPTLPNYLGALNCAGNQLTQLPPFPQSLNALYCDNNQLTTLPDLPMGGMYYVWCNNNPNLACLPLLPRINNFQFSNCALTCLPNYPFVLTSTPLLSSLPLCNVFNAGGCAFFSNISGKAYLDTNADCIYSPGEKGARSMHINLFENGSLVQQAFTGSDGSYSFDVNNFDIYDVQLDTTLMPFTSICPVTNDYTDTISATDSLYYNDDFSLQCKNGFDVGVWSLITTTPLRPAHLSTVRINAGDLANYYGVSCASGISGSLTITIVGNAHYYSAAVGFPAPSNVSGNVITYNIADYGNSDSLFSFVLETDTSATTGTQICFDAAVSPTLNDNNDSNNVFSICYDVMASLDPNEKEVYPKGTIDTSQHDLTFTINFQNTGNAAAENIYILDTLSSNFDLSSFQLLSTSHNAYVQILDGGIAKFNFPNINLPDSTSNEPMSHGYAQYKVRLKNNLPIGTHISNTAYIYFDFNSPVVTNTTSNTIDIGNGIATFPVSHSLNVWPVPFQNEFMIEGDPLVKGCQFSVVNYLGTEMVSGTMKNSQMKIAADEWSAGIYFLRVEMRDGAIVRKLVKD